MQVHAALYVYCSATVEPFCEPKYDIPRTVYIVDNNNDLDRGLICGRSNREGPDRPTQKIGWIAVNI